ncbi:hypothetical protein PENTCL1PPCAC_21123, partial [Pristionchus entomophagus]
MLNVVYPSGKNITDQSAEYLLKLGDRFQIACVMERSEKFLITSTDASAIEKLRIANKYKLVGLKQRCLNSLETVQQFKDI